MLTRNRLSSTCPRNRNVSVVLIYTTVVFCFSVFFCVRLTVCVVVFVSVVFVLLRLVSI